MILLDTCVISEVARAAPNPSVLAWYDGLPDAGLYLSVLTLGELRKGMDLLDDGQRKERLET